MKEHEGTKGIFNTSDSFESFPAVIAVFSMSYSIMKPWKKVKILEMLFKQNNWTPNLLRVDSSSSFIYAAFSLI